MGGGAGPWRVDPPVGPARPQLPVGSGPPSCGGTALTSPRDPGRLDRQPTLRGALVALRPLRAEDDDALYAVASDPLIWEQHPARNRHEPAVFREFFREALACGGALLVQDATTGAVIGSTRYDHLDVGRSEVEIGWTFLARACWGGRFNGEMKALMLAHAFGWVDHVVFVIGVRNLRSRRAVEKIGGVLVGQRVDAVGGEKVVYGIDAGAWRERMRKEPSGP